jgi:hypothetical protein
MAYFIFLKYLDSLEDFRKNPHVKLPPKSPSTNFRSLGIFKNQIFIRKRIFLHFRPSGQSAHPAFRPSHGPPPLSPALTHRPAGPPGLSLPSLIDVRAAPVIFFPEPSSERRRPSRPGRASQGHRPAPAPW